MSHTFDFDKALEDLQAGKDLTGKDGVLMPLVKQLTEAPSPLNWTITWQMMTSRTERTDRVQK
ncbi:MAG: hypothetical protein ACI915_003200 [Gammaproteobacteria bacterium]|jgi:hypothetical protein